MTDAITRGSWVSIHDRADGPFHVIDIKRVWLKFERLDFAIDKAPMAQAHLCDGPDHRDCNSPIWRLIDGEWRCLNCPLHTAIQARDDVRRAELVTLIDATREKAGVRR